MPGDRAEEVPAPAEGLDPVTMLVVPSSIEIQHTASAPESRFLRALEQGKLLAARTGDGGKVYFPPKEADPATGKELDQFVELGDTGTVTTFAIINIPFPGQRIKPPYVAAYILLDGADIPFLHLVTEIDAADVARTPTGQEELDRVLGGGIIRSAPAQVQDALIPALAL